jgi:hypothetical protein
MVTKTEYRPGVRAAGKAIGRAASRSTRYAACASDALRGSLQNLWAQIRAAVGRQP